MPPIQPFSRTRGSYLVSSSPTLLSLPVINSAFALPSLFWASPMPEPTLRTLLSNSYCLGLYRLPTGLSSSDSFEIPSKNVTSPTNDSDTANIPGTDSTPLQVGLARLITDHVTFAWLTDVYVLPEEQGKGLGTWLVECVGEVLAGMPELRSAMCGVEEENMAFYERVLGMKLDVGAKVRFIRRPGPGAYDRVGRDLDVTGGKEAGSV